MPTCFPNNQISAKPPKKNGMLTFGRINCVPHPLQPKGTPLLSKFARAKVIGALHEGHWPLACGTSGLLILSIKSGNALVHKGAADRLSGSGRH